MPLTNSSLFVWGKALVYMSAGLVHWAFAGRRAGQQASLAGMCTMVKSLSFIQLRHIFSALGAFDLLMAKRSLGAVVEPVDIPASGPGTRPVKAHWVSIPQEQPAAAAAGEGSKAGEDGTAAVEREADGKEKEKEQGAPTEAVLLYAHGGAWVSGGPLGSCSSFTRVLLKLRAAGVRARMLAVEYDLAPESPFPAAMEQVVAAGKWLLAGGAREAVGDSAGGNLVLSALMALAQGQGQGPASAGGPLFAGALIICPVADVSPTSALALTDKLCEWKGVGASPAVGQHIYPCKGGASSSNGGATAGGGATTPDGAASGAAAAAGTVDGECACIVAQRARMARDALHAPNLMVTVEQYTGQPASGPLASHPHVSPVHASAEQWRGALGLLGPGGILVLAGADEIFLPDIQHLADKARSAAPRGTSVQLHVEPGAIHNYPMLPLPGQDNHLQAMADYVAGAAKAWSAGSK